MTVKIAAVAAALILGTSATAGAAAPTMSYQLSAQNGSGETGTITLTPTPDGAGTVVTVTTTGQGADPQPIHVHVGPCATLDPKPTYPLTMLKDGKSETTLKEVSEADLTSGKWSINVHKSAKEAAIYVACADLAPPMKSAGKM